MEANRANPRSHSNCRRNETEFVDRQSVGRSRLHDRWHIIQQAGNRGEHPRLQLAPGVRTRHEALNLGAIRYTSADNSALPNCSPYRSTSSAPAHRTRPNRRLDWLPSASARDRRYRPRRSLLMARGACTPAEYWRMGEEKAAAMRSAMAAIMTGRSQAAVLAPFITRARANPKRLRQKA